MTSSHSREFHRMRCSRADVLHPDLGAVLTGSRCINPPDVIGVFPEATGAPGKSTFQGFCCSASRPRTTRGQALQPRPACPGVHGLLSRLGRTLEGTLRPRDCDLIRLSTWGQGSKWMKVSAFVICIYCISITTLATSSIINIPVVGHSKFLSYAILPVSNMHTCLTHANPHSL